MSLSRLVLILMAGILLAGLGLVIYGNTRPLHRDFHGQLVDLLPPAPPGWIKTARPIANTPEMKQTVDELLDYDQGVFYDYTKGGLRLSVYAAYWHPGKMPSRLIAGHTPDVCWVGAGWTKTASREATPIVVGQPLPLTEIRTFTANGVPEHVWYWHLVDGRPVAYNTDSRPPWYAAITDMLSLGLNQRAEQFFIRLSSPQPLTDPALQPALASVLRSLPLKGSGR